MLAPDYLDHAPDRLVMLWQQAEDDILRDVARRIGKMDALTTKVKCWRSSCGATSRPRPSARIW